ncbi:AdoMet-dependent rRNA methyltransferase SPB1 [Nematocida sp. AWRm80]|nr:AdoMet-dependent rRNA methyltransferase SPB1 [Nematocida sp. AWRm80]
MAAKRKTGKSRLDKYYFMAKDHGYRARSAFKLIQINQTYNILSNIHSVVDLCAAPGGWLQVASKTVLPPSKIIGVDLDAIKPIHGVQTLVGDITDEMCKTNILNMAGETEIDVVLHDGAPNVGASWEKDAYVQNELVCHAAKLACKLLKKNGTFVTKVFRSKDFNSIVWAISQLFTECLTTKPRSSREESAEVFLVCRGYKKPQKLDERFFDPQFVFAEKDEEKVTEISLSALLKTKPICIKEYQKITVDCMENMIDPETQILLDDLQLVNDMDKKRLIRVLKKIQKVYIGRTGGNQPEEIIDMRTPVEKQQDEMIHTKRAMERREKILQRKILAKRTKRLGLTENDIEEIEKIHGDFFEDQIFDSDESNHSNTPEILPEETSSHDEESEEEQEDSLENTDNSEDIDEDSVSSSLSVEDKVCGYRLKINEEEFENDGIDRYVYNEEDHLPQFFKDDEAKYNRRFVFNEDRDYLEEKATQTKKQLELQSRRERRINKKVERIKSRLQQAEQEVDLRAIKKNIIKKEKRVKKQAIFAGPSHRIPKVKGRIQMTDRRMKKDKAGLRRAEERKKHKKRH